MFYRIGTDGVRTEVGLQGTFGGPQRTSVWLIGGGRTLTASVAEQILRTPVPRMCINLAGTGLLRPTLWTSYDPSARFHRSVYLDAGVMKFVHRRRAMDLVPETTFKVCECPQTYFFERDVERGFGNFLSQGHRGIVDWADSMVQGIDLLYQLGFRRIYLAGSEMRVRPTEEQIRMGRAKGVEFTEKSLLSEFVNRCRKGGLSEEILDESGPADVYHFAERKPIRAAANTDFHYFRVAQYLRLSRRAMATAGLELISVTPGSRLNDYFPFIPIEEACAKLMGEVGDPDAEEVTGRYRLTGPRIEAGLGPMKDFKPHRWGEEKLKQRGENKTIVPHLPEPGGSNLAREGGNSPARLKRLREELEIIDANELGVNEEG